jgi:hypothetical protein
VFSSKAGCYSSPEINEKSANTVDPVGKAGRERNRPLARSSVENSWKRTENSRRMRKKESGHWEETVEKSILPC